MLWRAREALAGCSAERIQATDGRRARAHRRLFTLDTGRVRRGEAFVSVDAGA